MRGLSVFEIPIAAIVIVFFRYQPNGAMQLQIGWQHGFKAFSSVEQLIQNLIRYPDAGFSAVIIKGCVLCYKQRIAAVGKVQRGNARFIYAGSCLIIRTLSYIGILLL